MELKGNQPNILIFNLSPSSLNGFFWEKMEDRLFDEALESLNDLIMTSTFRHGLVLTDVLSTEIKP